jgi:PilZ domain
LVRPDNTADMGRNKRDRERFPLEGQVRGEVMVFQPMTILDISIAGAQIETAFALQLDSLHDFRLSLSDRSVVVKGRVAHCHIGELTDVAAYYRTGVEFIDLSDHARDAISHFVLAMKYAQSPPTIVDGEIVGGPQQ